MTGLAERVGYAPLPSFTVVYLGELGFGSYWPGLPVDGGLATLVYLLPLVWGSLAALGAALAPGSGTGPGAFGPWR